MSEELNSTLNNTSFRKLSHLEICLKDSIEAQSSTCVQDFKLVHRPLADLNFDEIDTSTDLWGKKLHIPLLAAAMTGGHPEVRLINERIARISAKYQLAMGVGSQRAALEKNIPYISESFSIVRELAPHIALIGNLGAAQFSNNGKFGLEQIQKAIDLIQADAIAIHINPAQEIVQIEGDRHFQGFFQKIIEISSQLKLPIILKEVGSGFCKEDAQMVQNSSLAGIDVGGLGGTSWIAVEAVRAQQKNERLCYEVGKTFWNWGIPTALSVVEVRSVMSYKTLIATGGVRNGLEAAILIALGADIVGMALPFLKAAQQSEEELEFLVNKFHHELKMAMFLTGCQTLKDLRKIPIVLTGLSKEWIQSRGIDIEMPWRYERR